MTTVRTGRTWLGAAGWALIGAALLTGSLGPGLWVSGQVADERAFLTAPPCGAGGVAGDSRDAPDTPDCLRTVLGTVESAEVAKSGRAKVFRVMLRPPVPAPANRSLNLDRQGELAELIEPGDEVEVRTWRDVQVSVSRGEVTETLPGLPDEDAAMTAGFTLVGVWLAALAFVAGFGSARRARHAAAGRPFAPRVSFGPAKAVGVVAVPLVAGFAAGRIWDGWAAVAMTVVISSLVALPATVAALRWDRDGSGGWEL
ncbi:hypothetical protein KPP03845_104143 [Streptomyces xanthophaeus]|uniref:hypothetical protein n=1 Tax=Streptomyces xanthophaeus TaxID=67385 RepID=UPI00233EADC9|nr:hypothetical protein [Streptomyces xanthophaeus]WCD87743.1 hypothetical protein KPP03845_104143 [Streptomyces xanthophaeus]